ncbi:MAG TPA: DUF2190 family protein [Burkholderiales bacterium]|nr:DUF2190 family protein [Burkholderiales bacterium]
MGLQNRTPSFQIETENLTLAGATTALTPVLQNSRVLIPLNTVGAGAPNAYMTKGYISGAPTANVAIAALDPCYWDNVAGNFTNVAGGNTRCGNFIDAVAGGAASGLIRFNTFQA